MGAAQPRPESAGHLRPVTDNSAWEWLTEQTHGAWASAGSVVPSGYEAATRIFHPAGDRRWSDVAAQRGTVMHPLAQWGSLAASHEPPGHDEFEPEEGTAPRSLIEAVLSHLPSGGQVYRAVWEGFGWWSEPRWDGPMLELPGRRHIVFSGPPGDLRQWPGQEALGSGEQSASLMWPTDRGWVLATEIDWDFTLLVSSAAVATRVQADSRLEAFAIGLEDDLSWFGDHVNPRPGWLEALAQDTRES